VRRLFPLLLIAAVVGGYFLLQNFEIEGLGGLRLKPKAGEPGESTPTDVLPVKRTGDSIRIGSFNIQVFGRTKIDKPHVMDRLAKIARKFDIVAIQEIRSTSSDILPRFVDMINATGRRYDFVISERLGRTSSKEQYAFVFDTQSVEVDRTQLYTISDPHDMLHREPYVAWFRVRGPPTDRAFTFTLVNIHTDPDEVKQELDALDDVFRAVRDDGRNEDDVIILGDLNVDDRHLGELGQIPGIYAAIRGVGVTTNTRGTKMYDNLVFHRGATGEFTGRAGVYDFMRDFNLTMDEALEISDHLPVWAEFDLEESFEAHRVAEQPGAPAR